MTTPRPWSFSALEQFDNCAKQYHEVRILRSVKQTDTEEMLWGTRVHKMFEERQRDKKALPDYLEQHEPFMLQLEQLPGEFTVENKIGFDINAQPCSWDVDNVWSRNIIDYRKVHNERALVVDYKTGKPHNKFKQLKLYALHTFAAFPAVQIVQAKFYWTKTGTVTNDAWGRVQIPELWDQFLPSLTRYRDAFKNDVWPAKPSGLCNGWCPVTSCEHWRPKRQRY